ncbi:MAG: DEAD/DEAH box helicase [Flavobacteriales bacterium Tduv]
MKTFEEANLNPKIVKALEAIGFTIPTPIQQQSIPYLLSSDRDLIALAQTGTGKTAAFGLPLIHKITPSLKTPQALVLCPTRELCLQITRDFMRFAQYLSEIKIVSVYGGANIKNQVIALHKGAHIIVGTPGRVIDLMRRGDLQLGCIRYLVLDEADEMLNMGFKDDIDTIVERLPVERQSLLFSATMSREMNGIANSYLEDPMEMTTGKRNLASDDVQHVYYMVSNQNRYLALKRIADVNPDIYGIIFCRTRRETKEIADRLIQDGYNTDALYGDLSQAQRESVMHRFREKRLQLLVATDVAARGIDISDITHVINYNLSDENETYVHRSGRTGRAGNQGISICLIHSRQGRRIKDIEQKIGRKFERLMVPTGREICEKQLFHLIEKIEKVVVDDHSIAPYLSMIHEKLSALDREQLIKRFTSVEFNRFLTYYKGAKDINVSESFHPVGGTIERKKRDFVTKGRLTGFSRLFLNLGAKDDLTKLGLIQLVNQATNTRNIDIGRIEISSKSSYFEIDSRHEDKVLRGLNRMQHRGRSISVGLKN